MGRLRLILATLDSAKGLVLGYIIENGFMLMRRQSADAWDKPRSVGHGPGESRRQYFVVGSGLDARCRKGLAGLVTRGPQTVSVSSQHRISISLQGTVLNGASVVRCPPKLLKEVK